MAEGVDVDGGDRVGLFGGVDWVEDLSEMTVVNFDLYSHVGTAVGMTAVLFFCGWYPRAAVRKIVP